MNLDKMSARGFFTVIVTITSVAFIVAGVIEKLL